MGQDKPSLGNNPALNETTEALARHEVPNWITDHLREYREQPSKGHWWDARAFGGYERTPTLLLTTKGRKTGRLLVMPLIYGEDAGRYILIGSKGGAPEHPAWYVNMLADPIVELQVFDEVFKARASTSSGEERKRLFEMMTKVYPPFPAYQERTKRELPVVVLERV